MSLQRLSDVMAFSVGPELWVLPSPACSHWARKIDWYLNFQIARAQVHQRPAFDPHLLKFLTEEGLAYPSSPNCQDQPLLVSGQGRLPPRYVVMVPFFDDGQAWLQEVDLVAQKLGSSSLRIFLPHGMSASQMESLWLTKTRVVTYVVDSEFHLTNSGS